MANNNHDSDNNGFGEHGNAGTNGRFGGDGGNEPGGRKEAGPASELADHIHGTDGNDVIDGLGDNDVLLGHEGNDAISGNLGDDNIGGGAGNDVLAGDDVLSDISYDQDGNITDWVVTETPEPEDGPGADTFSHSGDIETDGTDTIVDFDCATEVEGEWNVVDVIELDLSEEFGVAGDAETEGTGIFNDSNPNDDVIETTTLGMYFSVDGDGDLIVDSTGAGEFTEDNVIVMTDCFEVIDETTTVGSGVAIEINDQTFVWDEGAWQMA